MTISYKNINNCGWGYELRGVFDFVFYQAEVDVLAKSDDEWTVRARAVCGGDDVYRQIPMVVTMGGGYAPDIDVIVQGRGGVFGVIKELL